MPQDSVHTNETNPNKSMMEACMVYEVTEWSELSFWDGTNIRVSSCA